MTTPASEPPGQFHASAAHVSLWRLLEAYHAVLYFAPERTPHYKALGVKGGWMGYFATRSSPLGQVPTEVVTALFYNFKHSMVNRALPDAWRYTTPEKAYEARLRIFDQSITRLLGSELLTSPGHARAAELAIRAAQACPLPGRPLAAAYLAQPVPHETQLRLFWAATVLREYRGDGHIAALSSAGIDGCEANVLLSALGLVPPEQQQYRGWTDEDWAGGIRRLAERGWVTPKGNITKVGAQERAAVERLTDTLAAAPLLSVGDELVAELVELLTPLAARIVTAGGVPYPNGIGLPPAADAYSAS